MTVSSTKYGSGLEKAGKFTGTEAEVLAALANGNIHAYQIISITLSGTTCTAYYIKP